MLSILSTVKQLPVSWTNYDIVLFLHIITNKYPSIIASVTFESNLQKVSLINHLNQQKNKFSKN